MADNLNKDLPPKPIPLRVIFILNALMMVLPFIFYFVITSKGIDIGRLDPKIMIYTGIGYIVSFAVLVFFILKRNIMGVRGVLFANILISLPAKAIIGIVVAVISLLLAFLNEKVKTYFGI